MGNLIDTIREIEKIVCDNFEDLELDDPMEDGVYDEYLLIDGATGLPCCFPLISVRETSSIAFYLWKKWSMRKSIFKIEMRC